MNCFLCMKKLRQNKYELDYIGQVCSACFRISREKYVIKVDEIAEKRLEYLYLEITKSNSFQSQKW